MEVVQGKEEVFNLLQIDEFHGSAMDHDTNTLFRLLMPMTSHAEAKVEEDRLNGVVLYFDIIEFGHTIRKSIEWNERGFCCGRITELLRLLFDVMSAHYQSRLGEMAEQCHKVLQNAVQPIVIEMKEK